MVHDLNTEFDEIRISHIITCQKLIVKMIVHTIEVRKQITSDN